MSSKIWQVYKDVPNDKGGVAFFDVYFTGAKSACQKWMKSNPSPEWRLGYDATAEEFQWFDGRGNLIKDIPAECIRECSGSGDVTESVKFWVVKLGFDVSPALNIARKYLDEFGAWEDLEEVGSYTLSQRVLWVACCELNENPSGENWDGFWFGMIH